MIRRLIARVRAWRRHPDLLTDVLRDRIDGVDGRRTPRPISDADLAEFARIVGSSLSDLRRTDPRLPDLYLTPDQEKS